MKIDLWNWQEETINLLLLLCSCLFVCFQFFKEHFDRTMRKIHSLHGIPKQNKTKEGGEKEGGEILIRLEVNRMKELGFPGKEYQQYKLIEWQLKNVQVGNFKISGKTGWDI